MRSTLIELDVKRGPNDVNITWYPIVGVTTEIHSILCLRENVYVVFVW